MLSNRPDPLDPEADLHVGRLGHQVRPDRRAGRHAVGAREGQVRRVRLGLEGPAGRDSAASTVGGEVGQVRLTLAQPEPERARPTVRREHAGAADRDVERARPSPRRAHRVEWLAAIRSSSGRAEEPQRQVEAVEADPANVATATRDTRGPDALDE